MASSASDLEYTASSFGIFNVNSLNAPSVYTVAGQQSQP